VDTRKVENVVRKVRHLQFITCETGFITSRSQGDLFRTLTPDELVLAGEMLHTIPVQKADDDENNL
jgi:hypothetical protein